MLLFVALTVNALTVKKENSPETPTVLAQLYRLHRGRMYRYALSLLKNGSDAEDAVQEAFLALFRYQPDFADLGAEKTLGYLQKCVRSACIRQMKKRRRSPASLSLEECGEEPAEQEEVFSGTCDAIRRAILSLPTIYRDPMALYCLYEEPPGRIAALLGISEQAVRSRIRRGRALLKKTLGKEFGE